tara:strand:- start:267 stop:497 length:231 start_codon:yes stop_codon:yes gene_type:complete
MIAYKKSCRDFGYEDGWDIGRNFFHIYEKVRLEVILEYLTFPENIDFYECLLLCNKLFSKLLLPFFEKYNLMSLTL